MPLRDDESGAWYIDLLKLAGQKLGEQVVRSFIDRFGGPEADAIKRLIFGDPVDLAKYLKDIDQKLSDIIRLVKDHYQFDLFANYNDADHNLGMQLSAYTHSGPGSRDRINACLVVLDADGAFAQCRRMAMALLAPNQPSNKSVMQLYADLLLDSYLDVYSYRDALPPLLAHLRLNLIQAAALRALCSDEIADKSKEHDSVISDQEVAHLVDLPAAEILRPSTELIDIFESAFKSRIRVRLLHCDSGSYLTIDPDGDPHTTRDPFGYYIPGFFENNPRQPQVFVAEMGTGQVKRWGRPDVTGREQDWHNFILSRDTQEWLVDILPDPDDAAKKTITLTSMKAPMCLDGTYKNYVYVNKPDLTNTYMRWQPALTTNKAGQYQKGLFILKHRNSQHAVWSGGGHLTGGDTPRNDNQQMKWQLAYSWPDTLLQNEFNLPGGQLQSANGRYSLRYMENGDLCIIDGTSGNIIWNSHGSGRGLHHNGPGKLIMHSDGNCVTYAADNTPTWESLKWVKGSKAFLTNQGQFVNIPPGGRWPDGDWTFM